MACKPNTELESAGMDIGVAVVVGVTNEIAAGGVDAHGALDIKFPYRIDDQQSGVALVALSVEEQRVGIGKVLVLVALPGKNAVIVGLEDETSEAPELHVGLGLEREARTHVVVTVNNVIVVALGSAKEYSAQEDPLLQPIYRSELQKIPASIRELLQSVQSRIPEW